MILGLLSSQIGTPAAAATFSGLYVFGDSDSDVGNRLVLEGIPVPPYFNGRHSNGPVEVEQFAADLGLPIGPSQSGGNDYAVGGAFSGHGNIDPSPTLANTGVLDQVSQFLAGPGNGGADPNALYVINAGGNDFSAHGSTQTTADAIIANEEAAIAALATDGAQHFFVWNHGGFGIGFGTQLVAALNAFATTNSYDILTVDYTPLLVQMQTPGNPFGFTHGVGDPCFTGSLSSGLAGHSLCNDPQDYVFWDPNNHLTTTAYQILGDAMAANYVPEPGPLALLLPAWVVLGAISWRVRRPRKSRRCGWVVSP